MTHTQRNLSAALLLQREIGRFMYASTYSYRQTHIAPSYDIAYSDVASLPLLSTETLDAFSVGSECTRVEKTLRIADIADTWNTLDVCAHDGGDHGINCSKCKKCMRTLLTLDAAGLLDRYAECFDLDLYRSSRDSYVRLNLHTKDPLLHEVFDFARLNKFPIPAPSRLYGFKDYFAKLAPGTLQLARNIKRALKPVRMRPGSGRPATSGLVSSPSLAPQTVQAERIADAKSASSRRRTSSRHSM